MNMLLSHLYENHTEEEFYYKLKDIPSKTNFLQLLKLHTEEWKKIYNDADNEHSVDIDFLELFLSAIDTVFGSFEPRGDSGNYFHNEKVIIKKGHNYSIMCNIDHPSIIQILCADDKGDRLWAVDIKLTEHADLEVDGKIYEII